ncbi:hypothetical protein BTS2_3371 [Bacillus sp. TS-2]|nr:hypothetical protein BTS2_3371 [Bacillus sp. TS-2]
MSNLLQKNKNKEPKKIERSEPNKPSNTYKPNDIFTVKEEVKEKEAEKKLKEKITTVRVTNKNKDRLNALVMLKGLQSVDNMLNQLLNEYESTLSKDKLKEYEMIQKIYKTKK